jgi:hypothetical protein
MNYRRVLHNGFPVIHISVVPRNEHVSLSSIIRESRVRLDSKKKGYIIKKDARYFNYCHMLNWYSWYPYSGSSRCCQVEGGGGKEPSDLP